MASPFIVREAPRGAILGPDVLEQSGLDLVRASLEQGFEAPPVTRLTGLRLSEAGLGLASAWMPASPWWQSGAGVFLAGTVAFVADWALGASVMTSAPPGFGITTSELSVNYLRAATMRSQTITAHGRLLYATRTLGLAEATIGDARGRSLGHATERCVLFRLDPKLLAARHLSSEPHPETPDPYLREVEGDVYGSAFWDATPLTTYQQFAAGTLVPPCFQLMGIRGVDIRKGEIVISMPTSAWLCNAFGVIYGGALAYLADAAMIMAAGSTADAGTAFGTIDLKLYFLRPVTPGEGELMARAKVVHRGRTIAVVNCEITRPDGVLVAQGASSVLILPGRHWERPVQVAEEITVESAGEVAPESPGQSG